MRLELHIAGDNAAIAERAGAGDGEIPRHAAAEIERAGGDGGSARKMLGAKELPDSCAGFGGAPGSGFLDDRAEKSEIGIIAADGEGSAPAFAIEIDGAGSDERARCGALL